MTTLQQALLGREEKGIAHTAKYTATKGWTGLRGRKKKRRSGGGRRWRGGDLLACPTHMPNTSFLDGRGTTPVVVVVRQWMTTTISYARLFYFFCILRFLGTFPRHPSSTTSPHGLCRHFCLFHFSRAIRAFKGEGKGQERRRRRGTTTTTSVSILRSPTPTTALRRAATAIPTIGRGRVQKTELCDGADAFSVRTSNHAARW